MAPAAAGFVTSPWTVEVEGLAHKPRIFDLDELPWHQPARGAGLPDALRGGLVHGHPLGRLPPVQAAGPGAADGQRAYVAFETLADPRRMPGHRPDVLPGPTWKVCGWTRRMHPLTLLAIGLYGRDLPPQNGAPLRLVVPWKYGFKGIKSIVKIRWWQRARHHLEPWTPRASTASIRNVNPQVDHPALEPGHRATHRRIGPATDADVQWLRRPSREFVCGNESQVELLIARPMRPSRRSRERHAMR